MSRIIIENIGPLKKIDIDLKKVNVFIGPQASGKSTLVKIICFCKWFEKHSFLYNADNYIEKNKDVIFKNNLQIFHRLDESFFSKKSKIIFEGEYLDFSYLNRKISVMVKKGFRYYNNKLIYIPAERNIVSTLPNLDRYKETNDNLLNFVYDWFDIKQNYLEKEPLSILNLNIDYFYNDESKSDNVLINNEKKDVQKTVSDSNIKLKLQNSSSGVQSLIPLMMMVDYLSKRIFEIKKPKSFLDFYSLRNQFSHLLNTKPVDMASYLIDTKLRDEIGYVPFLPNETPEPLQIMEFFDLFLRQDYHYTQFFIEEPEQNLFPETQRELIQHIIKACYNKKHQHELFLTTHSHFVLYVINNCILASKVKNKIKRKKGSLLSPIPSEDIEIWEIKNGTVVSIQDTDGLINRNYFDDTMKEVMDEFYELMEHYEN